jgi:HK97 gp10 family phage protein
MRIRVDVDGDRATLAALARSADNMSDLRQPTTEAANAVRNRAAGLAAKRTGRLAASNRVSVAGGTGVVSNRTPYASFQEYGTSVMNAHPYLRPALYGAPIDHLYEQHADRALRPLR